MSVILFDANETLYSDVLQWVEHRADVINGYHIYSGYYTSFGRCYSFWCDLCNTISDKDGLDISYIYGPYEGMIDSSMLTCSHTDGSKSTVSFDRASIYGYNMMFKSRHNAYIVGTPDVVQGLDEYHEIDDRNTDDISSIRYETVLWNDVKDCITVNDSSAYGHWRHYNMW
jgi:hypothetical protein